MEAPDGIGNASVRFLEAPLRLGLSLTAVERWWKPRYEAQYQVDIPPVQPVTTQFNRFFRRGHEVVECLRGEDFAGLLECDCFLAYDPLGGPQQKCLQHLLRRCETLQTVRPAPGLPNQPRSRSPAGPVPFTFDTAIGTRVCLSKGYRVACGRLEAALD